MSQIIVINRYGMGKGGGGLAVAKGWLLVAIRVLGQNYYFFKKKNYLSDYQVMEYAESKYITNVELLKNYLKVKLLTTNG